MKVVCFKIEGEKYSRMGPALQNDTIESVLNRLSKTFNVNKAQIKILELS
jgi:hypothetical protein